jgi:hypothetical protein
MVWNPELVSPPVPGPIHVTASQTIALGQLTA